MSLFTLPRLLTLAALAVPAGVAGCAEPPAPVSAPASVEPPDTGALTPDAVAVAVEGVARVQAQIEPVGSGRAEGTVTLSAVQGGVRVRAQLEGLSREQYHALQILGGRDCDADPDLHLGADAGTPHGGLYAPPGLRHAGDLGSVRGDDGTGRYDRVDNVLSLSGTASPVGHAVVVRALRDDAASPGGAAGAVIGCGILEPS